MFALNVLLMIVVIGSLLLLVRSEPGLSTVDATLIAALPAVTGNFLWLTTIGMEHLLFVAAIFSAAYFWLPAPRDTARSRPALAGICCGLAIVTRQEALFLVPAFLATGLMTRRPLRDYVRFLIPIGAGCGLVMLNNLWTSNAVMPVTFSGRRWLLNIPTDSTIFTGPVMMFMGLFYQICSFFIGIPANKILLAIVSPLVLFIILLGIYRLYYKNAWNILFLIALGTILLLIYAVSLPTRWHGMRYQALVMPFIYPLLGLGLIESIAIVRRRMGRTTPCPACETVAAGIVATVALAVLVQWVRYTDAAVVHVNGTEVRMGEWLAENLPPGTRVASFDIGAITYFSGLNIVDLGGLIDPTFVPHLYAGTTASYLKEKNIEYLVLPIGDVHGEGPCLGLEARLKLCDGDRLTKTEIKKFETPSDVWRLGREPIGHANRQQVLYKLSWN